MIDIGLTERILLVTVEKGRTYAKKKIEEDLLQVLHHTVSLVNPLCNNTLHYLALFLHIRLERVRIIQVFEVMVYIM